eukprot:TRINITY_DN39632_c0_g1_i1.p1 TRINITY_DN39632_c0_g1~~TRINITY_DN39632_c0_g1_i1.p1  ORF type:complete len:1730 (+),score=273.06 TRINITY_DN39632_c0_g1_i1:138-5327(+)
MRGTGWLFIVSLLLLLRDAGGQAVVAPDPVPTERSNGDRLRVRVGGTCSFTGPVASLCEDLSRTLDMYRRQVQADKPFVAPDGRNLELIVSIEDDRFSPKEAESLYANFAASGNYDAFLAPLGTNFTSAAHKAVNESGYMLVAYSAGTMEPREGVFNVDVPLKRISLDALNSLWQQGSRTFAMIWDPANEPRSRAICMGAKDEALSLGYEVLDVIEYTDTNVTHDIMNMRSRNPHVFMVCGSVSAEVTLVVTSRAMHFNPQAMIVSQATTAEFGEEVGAVNANYLLVPDIWHKNLQTDGACRVFGTAANFMAKFEQFYGAEPRDPATASAAIAAVTAILAAYETIPVDSNALQRQQQLGQALHALDEPSIVGRLRFDMSGQIMGREGVTLQLLPLPEDRSPKDRYTQSTIELVAASGLGRVVYPLPEWVSKELEIYPCRPGYQIDVRTIEKTTIKCLPCKPDNRRSAADLSCLRCPTGSYAQGLANFECTFCLPGSDCGDERKDNWDVTLKAPHAKAGYWMFMQEEKYDYYDFDYLDDYAAEPSPPVYMPCPAGVCAGENTCLGQNTGVLCLSCKAGYKNFGSVVAANDASKYLTRRHTANQIGHPELNCVECNPPFLIAGEWLLLFAAYGLAISFVAQLAWMAATDLESIYSVVVKITVNYFHFTVTAFSAGQYAWVTLRLEAANNPITHLMNFQCLASTPFEAIKYRLIFAWILMPLAVAVNAAAFSIARFLYLWRLMYVVQTTRRRRDAGLASTGQGGEEEAVEGSPKERSRQNEEKREKQALQELKEQGGLWAVESDAAHRVHAQHINNLKGKSAAWTVSIVFLLYPIVVKAFVDGVACVELDELRMKHDLDTLCQHEDHYALMQLAVPGLLIYGLGVPILGWRLLHLHRHNLAERRQRRRFCLLIHGFKEHCYYWEILFTFRKLLVLLLPLWPYKTFELASMLILSVFYLLTNLSYRPYDRRGFGKQMRVETGNLSVFFVVLLGEAAFVLRLLISEEESSLLADLLHGWWFETVVGIAVVIANLMFLTCASWNFFRDTYVRGLIFKQECLPQSVTPFETMLLTLMPNFNRLSMNVHTQQMNLTALTKHEKRFLTCLFADLVEWYISSDWPFHAMRLVTAMREAMAYAVKARGAMAVNTKHEVSNPHLYGVRGWLGSGPASGPVYSLVGFNVNEPSLGENYVDAKAAKDSLKKSSRGTKVSRSRKSLVMQVLDGDTSLNGRRTIHYLANAFSHNSSTVEQFGDALAVCARDIVEQRQLFYVIEVPEQGDPMEETRERGRDEGHEGESSDDAESPGLVMRGSHLSHGSIPSSDHAQLPEFQQLLELNMVQLTAKYRDMINARESLLGELQGLRSEIQHKKSTDEQVLSRENTERVSCPQTAHVGEQPNHASDVEVKEASIASLEGLLGHAPTNAELLEAHSHVDLMEPAKDPSLTPVVRLLTTASPTSLPQSNSSQDGKDNASAASPQVQIVIHSARSERATSDAVLLGSELHAMADRPKLDLTTPSRHQQFEDNASVRAATAAVAAHPLASSLRQVSPLARWTKEVHQQEARFEDRRADHILISAIVANDVAKVEAMLAAGARTDAQDEHGKEPWDYARDNEDMLKLLEAYDPEAKVRSSARVDSRILRWNEELITACIDNDVEVVEAFLRKGISPSTQDERGCELLEIAAENDSEETCALIMLIDKHAKHRVEEKALQAFKQGVSLPSWLERLQQILETSPTHR